MATFIIQPYAKEGLFTNAKQQEVLGKWLEFAEQDLEAASVILSREDFHPRIACFLSQQSTEKALKTLLIYNGLPIRKIHDLEQLSIEVPPEVKTCLESADLEWLTNWAVERRYPGDWPEAAKEDALRAVEIARGVVAQARKFLEAHLGELTAGASEDEKTDSTD